MFFSGGSEGHPGVCLVSLFLYVEVDDCELQVPSSRGKHSTVDLAWELS